MLYVGYCGVGLLVNYYEVTFVSLRHWAMISLSCCWVLHRLSKLSPTWNRLEIARCKDFTSASWYRSV